MSTGGNRYMAGSRVEIRSKPLPPSRVADAAAPPVRKLRPWPAVERAVRELGVTRHLARGLVFGEDGPDEDAAVRLGQRRLEPRIRVRVGRGGLLRHGRAAR